jgi:hypothetical protein
VELIQKLGIHFYQRHSDKTSPKTLKIREFIAWHGSYFFGVPKRTLCE